MTPAQAAQHITVFHGQPLDVISWGLRGMLIAAPGHDLLAADFANIEGRGLAWLAGEEWKLQAFRDFDTGTGPDLYKLMASQILRKPIEDVTSEERQASGKVPELACLAPDTQVLTSSGYKTIVGVLADDLLWDGVEWVKHAGLVARGARPVVSVAGMSLTPDHLILTGRTWRPASQLVSSQSTLRQALATGLANLPSQATNLDPRAVCALSGCGVPAVPRRTPFTPAIFARGAARGATLVPKSKAAIGVRSFLSTLTWCAMTATGAGCLAGYRPASTGATITGTATTQITGAEVFGFTALGERIGVRSWPISLLWSAGTNRIWRWIASKWTGVTSRAICALSAARATKATDEKSQSCSNESPSLSFVYDVAHAGPRNRFTVLTDAGPLIVHNCGYGGGVGAFQMIAKTYGVKVDDIAADVAKNLWRQSNPEIVSYWYDLERAAFTAVAHAGQTTVAGRAGRQVRFKISGSFLWCLLPSGRALCYPYPKIKAKETPWGEFKDQVHYMTVDGMTNKWIETHTYGGKLAENITQAICRDLLAYAIVNCEAEGFPVVLHVHDEVVSEVPQDWPGQLAEFECVCSRVPDWAGGLPIVAKGFRGKRYRK